MPSGRGVRPSPSPPFQPKLSPTSTCRLTSRLENPSSIRPVSSLQASRSSHHLSAGHPIPGLPLSYLRARIYKKLPTIMLIPPITTINHRNPGTPPSSSAGPFPPPPSLWASAGAEVCPSARAGAWLSAGAEVCPSARAGGWLSARAEVCPSARAAAWL